MSSRSPLETYLAECRDTLRSGSATPETSYYPALKALFDSAGHALKPRVKAIVNLANRGAGLPDGGLFTADQLRSLPAETDAFADAGAPPARGAIEVKSPREPVQAIAAGAQAQGYCRRYRALLVTNLREFLLLKFEDGVQREVERFALADTEAAFHAACAQPRATAERLGARFDDFLARVLRHNAPLADPKDVAWFLASYARDARERLAAQSQLPLLAPLRTALENALGIKFEGEDGEHFFRSTLVQTLFYGVFAAWVLARRAGAAQGPRFDWRTAAWNLHVPMIRALYEQLAQPSRLGALDLIEPLDRAADTLNRVAANDFFQSFDDRHAVQYFYEPFLEAFDPALRRRLGVWYTPEEIVRYMVARVDWALEHELGLPDGLADESVVVLDPCCGTGAYVVEVLRAIERRLAARGASALDAHKLKRAAMQRVYGFELLPAPFVIAHLQIGLLLAERGAPLAEEERAGVYLTNALTGWTPREAPKTIAFPELEAERSAAEHVKLDRRIVVVLGNPPYDAFAGVAQDEEAELVRPYKEGLTARWGIRKYNLDDLYVRFFRLAERVIAERGGRGVVSFISNYSWTSESSFVVLRERLLASFDRIWIENMHGNRKISEYAPDGRSSETVFAVPGLSAGIQQGVVISLWTTSGRGRPAAEVRYRDDLNEARAAERRAQLLASLDDPQASSHYLPAKPTVNNRLSFLPAGSNETYDAWPRVTELAEHAPICGLNENRRGALIAIDRAELAERMRVYFDADVDDATAASVVGGLLRKAARFDPLRCRREAVAHLKFEDEKLRRFTAGLFDNRWCYWSGMRPIWNEPRPDLFAQHWPGNAFLHLRRFARRARERAPMFYGTALPELHIMDPDIVSIPLRWREGMDGSAPRANLSPKALRWLANLGLADPQTDAALAEAPWLHALAIGYSPAWMDENESAIRSGFPRVPLPATRERLLASAALGRQVAALLDVDAPVPGVTAGRVREELAPIAVVACVGGGALDAARGDFALTAGWGHAGKEGVTMPGKGRLETRAHEPPDAALRRLLGDKTHDVYLNAHAYWRNVPEKVWDYTIGGYQVLKKWLSYRESKLLGRDLRAEEIEHFTAAARRIAAILLLGPELDANYRACAADAYAWPAEEERG